MLTLLSFRHLVQRPWRTLFLLAGYALGVGVMVVLLSIGTAMLSQARDERLVGGGEITVLPEGIDVEVMKTGGLGGMFLSIDHARFVYRQVLASRRLAGDVTAAAPQIVGKLLYVTGPDSKQWPVLASGQIPSRNAAVGAGAALADGRWTDDSLDRQWMEPSPFELRNEIDHFHTPPAAVAADPSWAEWHYFNVVSGDGKGWAFISFIVAGAVQTGRWGGQVLVTLHEQGRPARRFVANVPAGDVRLSTTDADLRIGASSVTVLPDGRYALHATAREEGSGAGAPLTLDLTVSPERGAYFPGAAMTADSLVSGYVVPALRADADGSICVRTACDRYQGAQAYHDHNWGVWRGVTWEWGAGRAGELGVLYGRVEAGRTEVGKSGSRVDSGNCRTTRLPDCQTLRPLFVYLTDSLGFLAVFRPQTVDYTDGDTISVNGHRVAVPSRGVMTDVRGDDSLRVELEVQDAAGTDTRQSGVQRGETGSGREIAHPYFIQMKGLLHVSGRVHGRPIAGTGTGFFETYR